MERGKLLCGLSNLTIKPVEVDTFSLILKFLVFPFSFHTIYLNILFYLTDTDISERKVFSSVPVTKIAQYSVTT